MTVKQWLPEGWFQNAFASESHLKSPVVGMLLELQSGVQVNRVPTQKAFCRLSRVRRRLLNALDLGMLCRAKCSPKPLFQGRPCRATEPLALTEIRP